MEKVYKYYEIAASEDCYRVRSDTVTQSKLLNYGIELINHEYYIDILDILNLKRYFTSNFIVDY